jgi:serine protease Do
MKTHMHSLEFFPMFNRHLIPGCLIATTVTTALVSTPPVLAAAEVRAVSAKQVGLIAKKTVVRIESSQGSVGSGVIIGRSEKGNKNVYTVLTAAHVVSKPEASYDLVAPVPLNSTTVKKRVKLPLNAKTSVTILPGVDLALITFSSEDTFAVGTIGNSSDADEGSPVYVAGFPQPGKAITRYALQFTGGMVSSRLDGEEDPGNQGGNGYDMAYTNITRAGMSGGPVFDAAGRIVAIHGQGDRESQNPDEAAVGIISNGQKTGFNLGIPIQTFLNLRPQARKSFGAKLDLSPLNYQLADNSVLIGTRNQKFVKKLRTRSGNVPITDVTKINEEIPE